MTYPITNFIQLIPGYMQNRAQSNQGLPVIGVELIEEYSLTGHAQVELDEWNADWNIQAEWIYRMGLPDTRKQTVMVVAYSWGAGFGFTQLAKKLRDRGVTITHAVLADPVYHLGPRWVHNIGLAQLAAYYPFSRCTRRLSDAGFLPRRPTIIVPDNVLRVSYFTQKNSKLCGHNLAGQSSETLITHREVAFRNHTNMDDCPEFTDEVRRVAQELFKPNAVPKRSARAKK
jgi:hypothetical protein